jgi:hypothetical protein
MMQKILLLRLRMQEWVYSSVRAAIALLLRVFEGVSAERDEVRGNGLALKGVGGCYAALKSRKIEFGAPSIALKSGNQCPFVLKSRTEFRAGDAS